MKPGKLPQGCPRRSLTRNGKGPRRRDSASLVYAGHRPTEPPAFRQGLWLFIRSRTQETGFLPTFISEFQDIPMPTIKPGAQETGPFGLLSPPSSVWDPRDRQRTLLTIWNPQVRALPDSNSTRTPVDGAPSLHSPWDPRDRALSPYFFWGSGVPCFPGPGARAFSTLGPGVGALKPFPRSSDLSFLAL